MILQWTDTDGALLEERTYSIGAKITGLKDKDGYRPDRVVLTRAELEVLLENHSYIRKLVHTLRILGASK